jgi:hypothetical protein
MRQALNLIDNWEEEDVVDPLSNDTGRRSASFDEDAYKRASIARQAISLQCSNALDAMLSICSPSIAVSRVFFVSPANAQYYMRSKTPSAQDLGNG